LDDSKTAGIDGFGGSLVPEPQHCLFEGFVIELIISLLVDPVIGFPPHCALGVRFFLGDVVGPLVGYLCRQFFGGFADPVHFLDQGIGFLIERTIGRVIDAVIGVGPSWAATCVRCLFGGFVGPLVGYRCRQFFGGFGGHLVRFLNHGRFPLTLGRVSSALTPLSPRIRG
jgi:hypothetical protein